ncbi:MAG TPA: GNAT family N-acetyltransferase [Egibacteraceae bacterium]|nr:GNAT family N-acetyltransferase [Egibacteraceae bacterium]
MSRRLQQLSIDNLDDMPASCRACVFWEVAGAHRGPAAGAAAKARDGKLAWWQATQLEWGTPGRAVYSGDQLIGYTTFAPADHFPQARRLSRLPSDDALLMATLWIHPDHRAQGLGRLLLHSVLREAHRRGLKAVEAFAVRGGDEQGTCLIDEGFLAANGFSVLQEHYAFPLMRLDLRQTVRWQEQFGSALQGVRSALRRPERAPARNRPALEAVGEPPASSPRSAESSRKAPMASASAPASAS